jgi:2-phosphoglycerate kinase
MAVKDILPCMNRFWLGGSSCAGKTSIARLLAAEHGLTLYSCDDHFEEHRRRADPARHPDFYRLMDMPMETLWARPVEAQAAELLRFYRDELDMVLEDLQLLSGPVIVEGVGLLPERIAEICPDPRHALWLISTPEFRRQAYLKRGPLVRKLLSRCREPEEAFIRWMERDDRVARHLAAGARRCGLSVLKVNGRQTVEKVAQCVAERFRLADTDRART